MHHLRKDPIVRAWIAEYQKDAWNRHRDCKLCGWPHTDILCCGLGSTFGQVDLGRHTYYIDASNVEFMRRFVDELGSGFHWRNEIFFDAVKGEVVVTHLESFNNTPQKVTWKIPLDEWDSITRFVAEKTACNCGADRTGPSAEAHLKSCPQA